MKEIWRSISECPRYKISNKGNVKSLRKNGKLDDIKPCKNHYGYLTFGLHKNGKRRTAFVHVEVAKAFIDNPNDYEDVHHIDYNKENCCADNLTWLSHADNVKDYNCTTHNPKYAKDSNGKYIEIKKDYNICLDCGKMINRYYKRCRKCGAKHREKNYVNGRPLNKKEIVSEMVKTGGNFSRASKKFNMSDRSLRKWCEKYDLPTHSKDWKK